MGTVVSIHSASSSYQPDPFRGLTTTLQIVFLVLFFSSRTPYTPFPTRDHTFVDLFFVCVFHVRVRTNHVMKILCMIWIVLSLPFFACTTRAETNGATIPETGSPGDDTVADTVADTTVPTAEITSDDNVVVVVDEDNPMDIGRGAGNDVELEEGIDVTLDHPSGSEHDVKVSNPDTEDSSIADDEGTVPNPAPSQQHGSGKQRLWGSPVQYEDDEHHRTIPQEEQAVKEEHHHNYNTHIHNPPKVDIYQDEIEEHGATPTHNHHHHHNLHIPFVPKSTHPPPPGFLISARVYIDPKDKLGHLDEDPITLPYWDCGAVGSTTSPLKVTDVSFRHSLTPSQGWTGTDGKHPVLAIAVSDRLRRTPIP